MEGTAAGGLKGTLIFYIMLGAETDSRGPLCKNSSHMRMKHGHAVAANGRMSLSATK